MIKEFGKYFVRIFKLLDDEEFAKEVESIMNDFAPVYARLVSLIERVSKTLTEDEKK